MSFGAWVKAKMSLDSSGVKAGVDSAKKEVGSFNTSLKSVAGTLGVAFTAGAAIAGIKSFTKSTIDLASHIKDLSEQTGLSTDELQAFQAAAMGTTGGVEAAGKGLIELRNAQQEALDGNKAQIEAFRRLGISLEDIANKSTPQLLEAVAKGYNATSDFSALVDILGKKNAPKLEGALKDLADNGFGALSEKAAAAGLAISESFADQLDATGDTMDRVLLRSQVFWSKMLVPALQWAKSTAAIVSSIFYDMFDQNRDYTFKQILAHAKEAKRNVEEQFKADTEKRADDRKRTEATEADRRKDKAEVLKNKTIDSALDDFFGDIDAEDTKARITQEAARKSEAQRLEAERKAAEAAAAEAERLSKEGKTPANSNDVGENFRRSAVAELRGGGADQFQLRFDSLRQVGANILGSGKVGGAVDRQGELVTIARRSEAHLAQLVQKQNTPPVSRMAPQAAVY